MARRGEGAKTRPQTAPRTALRGTDDGGQPSGSARAIAPHARGEGAVAGDFSTALVRSVREAAKEAAKEAIAELLEQSQAGVAAAQAAAATAVAAANTATRAAEAAAQAAAQAAPAHNRQESERLTGELHTARPAAPGGEMERQVVVRLPANGDSAALLAAAKAAVVAAAECDPTCIDGTHVLYKGKATQASGQAAQAAPPRARQAVVMVYMRHAAIAAAAVRHSARLASMDQFKGIYINEALTADQRRVRAAFWSGSAELHATRQHKGAIRWRHGVPHMRVQGEGGRVEWRAMALPQG